MKRPIIVLHEPQDDINIGNVARACTNFGITDLRLVRPRSGKIEQIRISGTKSDALLERMQRFKRLEDALADCTFSYAATSRGRENNLPILEPGAVVEHANGVEGPVAIVFGREDFGLSKEAVDLCDAVLTIPTDDAHPSLNLGQAALLVIWEFFNAAHQPIDVDPVAPLPKGQLERLFDQMVSTMETVRFVKSGDGSHIHRSMTDVFRRAVLSEREFSIWIGFFKEVEKYIEREVKKE